MIKQFFKFSAICLITLLGFISCDDIDNPEPLPKGDFENGFFISNEGNYGSPNASVTFIDDDLTQESLNIFSSVNGEDLGDVLQSITFDEEYAYLLVNNNNKIEVVDRYTFKSITTITENLKLPRYAFIQDGKLYVTNNGESSIEIFNTSSFAHVATIEIGKYVDDIKGNNDFVYIMDATWGAINTISVVDVTSNTVVKDITVGNGLNSIEIEGGILYALHDTGVTKINTSTNEIIEEILFEDGLTSASNLEVENDFIYFVSGSKIFKFSKDVTSLSNTEFVDTQSTGPSWSAGYGFSVVGDKLFYTDAKEFTENSEVMVYDLDGTLLKTFTAGIGAKHIYDND